MRYKTQPGSSVRAEQGEGIRTSRSQPRTRVGQPYIVALKPRQFISLLDCPRQCRKEEWLLRGIVVPSLLHTPVELHQHAPENERKLFRASCFKPISAILHHNTVTVNCKPVLRTIDANGHVCNQHRLLVALWEKQNFPL